MTNESVKRAGRGLRAAGELLLRALSVALSAVGGGSGGGATAAGDDPRVARHTYR